MPGARLRPAQELRAFEKVWLNPGASTLVSFELSERFFAYYDTADSDWADLVPRRPRELYPPPPLSRQRGAPG